MERRGETERRREEGNGEEGKWREDEGAKQIRTKNRTKNRTRNRTKQNRAEETSRGRPKQISKQQNRTKTEQNSTRTWHLLSANRPCRCPEIRNMYIMKDNGFESSIYGL